MSKKQKKLPKKLSDLILLALEDLAKVERSKGYTVNMSVWHDTPYYDTTCHVCFAGAVMAKSLDVAKDADAIPREFNQYTYQRLHALDEIRLGYVIDALSKLGKVSKRVAKELPVYTAVTAYSTSKRQFKQDMRRIVKQLKALNL